MWYSSRVTAYGAVEGYRPLPLADGAKMAAASAWRGKWADIIAVRGDPLADISRLADPDQIRLVLKGGVRAK